MKLQALNNTELRQINGGNDSSSLLGVLQGYINVSNTDEDGDTESTSVDFGLGSLLNFMND